MLNLIELRQKTSLQKLQKSIILVQIAKVKQEINNTCRNGKSKRIVRGSKRRTFNAQVLIKEYTTTVSIYIKCMKLI